MAVVLLEEGLPFTAVANAIDLPVQGNVSRDKRLREGMEIRNFWPEGALRSAKQYNPPWHALREPARWWRTRQVEREEVIEFTSEFILRKARWPSIDEFRRRFGKAPTNRAPGDAPGQAELNLEA